MTQKIAKGLLFLIFSFILSGCGQTIHEQLQENNWNITSTSGYSYTADFSETTITFEQGIFQTAMEYKISEDQLSMSDPQSKEKFVYVIETKEGEIILTPLENEHGALKMSENK